MAEKQNRLGFASVVGSPGNRGFHGSVLESGGVLCSMGNQINHDGERFEVLGIDLEIMYYYYLEYIFIPSVLK